MDTKLTKINQKAAGIDIGAEQIFISVAGQEVQSFDTFTLGYAKAIEYLKRYSIETVAMEATGIYWVSLYEMIEQAGIKVYLVNGAHVKNVPGRKSDVKDCQWIQQLHSYGLLRASFIPSDAIRELRGYIRQRETHIEMSSRQINLMHKALDLMNIKLQYVISQLQGASGMRIIRAILEGERDAGKLSGLCEKQILNKKKEQVTLSLEGHYSREHLFALRQAVHGYEFYQQQIYDCDKEIEALLNEMTDQIDLTICTPEKPIRHHKPAINKLHEKLLKMTAGRDTSQIAGLTDLSVIKVIAETGTDMSAWKTAKHFTSWLGLAPNIHQSGKTNKKRRRKAKTRAGQVFREAAQSIGQSKHLALGGFYRRIKSRSGAMVANVATARKLAVLFYNTLKYGRQFVEEGLAQYEERSKQKMQQNLIKKAHKLGFELVPLNVVH